MASSSNNSKPQYKFKVQPTELTNHSILQKLVEHGCPDLTSQIDPKSYSELPRHGGGYGDIYRGKMRDGRDVAVKVWRRFSNIDPSIAMKRSMREIYNWSKLKHENIHELLGVTEHQGQLGMVSLWMEYGDLGSFIFNNPEVDRNPWCIQVAAGVLYLHQTQTIHGDLKAVNILLSSELIAKISDFDCSLVSDSSMTFSATREARSTLRWAAPELLNDSEEETGVTKKTKESDIYALAMTLLEIKTGRLPYAECRDNNSVMAALFQQKPPKRPQEFSEHGNKYDAIWDLLTQCWSHNPAARPDAQHVFKLVRSELGAQVPPMHQPQDEIGPRLQMTHHIQREHFRTGMSVQETFELLLRHGCVDLSSRMEYKHVTDFPISSGGFGDIWRGQLYDGTIVAIKAWRISTSVDDRTIKHAARVINSWSKLRHPNIHQLMGFITFRDRLAMVSQWMELGTLPRYLEKNPTVDRYTMAYQVILAVAYLHKYDIVHGDIKGANILVSSPGIAQLAGFGSLIMSEASITFSQTTTSQNFTLRWAAPELLLEDKPKSKHSDVYALGMTIIEIFTGKVPYSEYSRDFTVMVRMQQGVTPARPADRIKNDQRGNKMWQLLVSCWNRDPAARPTAPEVLESFNEIRSIPT